MNSSGIKHIKQNKRKKTVVKKNSKKISSSKPKKKKSEKKKIVSVQGEKVRDELLNISIEMNHRLFVTFNDIFTESIAKNSSQLTSERAKTFHDIFEKMIKKKEDELEKKLRFIFNDSFVESIHLSGLVGKGIVIDDPTSLLEIATEFGTVSKDAKQRILDLVPSSHYQNILNKLEMDLSGDLSSNGRQLISRLTKCLKGKSNWRNYEIICKEILMYCFVPPLKEIIERQKNGPGFHIVDMLIFDSPKLEKSYLKMIFLQYGLSAIVIECKNYKEKLNGTTVTLTSKYLGEKELTTMGFIFTRIGFNENAIDELRRFWNNNKGMMIGFTDYDLIKMIELKDTGEDPSFVLWKKIQEFRLS